MKNQQSTAPEGQRVVPDEGLTLPDQEGAVWGPGLQAVLGQQPLGDLPAVPPGTQLPVEPLLRHVLVHPVGHLGGGGNGHAFVKKQQTAWMFTMSGLRLQ